MSLILNEKYVGKNSYYLYIRNRALRIYPLYFIILIISFLMFLIWQQDGLPSPISAFQKDFSSLHWTTIFYLIFQNVFILTQDIGSFFNVNAHGLLYFSPHDASTYPFVYTHSLIPQAWTLSIEFMFYLIAPLLVRKKLRILMLLIFLSLILRFFIYSIGFHHEPWTNKFAPTELIFFILGILAFRLFKKMKRLPISKVAFISLYCLFISTTLLYDYFPKILKLPINPIQWGYFLILFAFLPFIFYFFKNKRVDRFLGDLAYPIYISHVLIIFTVKNLNLTSDPNITSIISVIATVIFSIILMITIVERIETYRARGLNKKTSRKSRGFLKH